MMMHPYDTILGNPEIMGRVKDSFPVGTKQRQLVDMVEGSPSPGAMMSVLMRMFGLGDMLYETLKPFVPTPDMMIKDLKHDIDPNFVQENKEKVGARYAILGTALCVKETFSIGYLTGYMQGLIAAEFPVHMLNADTLMSLKMNFLAAEQLVEMGYVATEIAESIKLMADRLRLVAKGEA